MIEIHQDSLRFSFPAIAAEIEALLEAYVAKMLPSFLSEYPEMVIRELLEDRPHLFRASGSEKKIRKLVLGLTHEDIERLLREQVWDKAGLHGGHHPARMEIEFQRTLRIPDDGKTYPLPPSLGSFPLRHVDDFADRVPQEWLKRGGVLMPMYQAEALWMNFDSGYPFALKIAAGKINAVSGESWQGGLQRKPQDYVVIPGQPWLDGFAVAKGVIRQFVAMPLGAGYSVEEQLSGKAEFGGMQFQAIPMKARKYYESKVLPKLPARLAQIVDRMLHKELMFEGLRSGLVKCCAEAGGMGLGAGGRMRQEIYKDPHAAEDWDLEQSSRCFVHLCDALLWREITGENPPQTPVTAMEYKRAKLPWFDYYRDDLAVLEGSKTLASIKSVNTLSQEKNGHALPGNTSVKVPSVIDCSPKNKTVKEWVGE